MKVIEVQKFGDPDVMVLVERRKIAPGQGEVLVRVEATNVLEVFHYDTGHK